MKQRALVLLACLTPASTIVVGGRSAAAPSFQTAGSILRLRGGKKAEAPPPTSMSKIVPAWSGNALDAAIGTSIGGAAGFLVGKSVQTAVTTTITATSFVLTQTAFSAIVVRIAANLGIVTIHWGRCKELVPPPIKACLAGLAHALPTRIENALVGALDRDGDGKLTTKDAEIVSKANSHAAAGGVAGFTVGLVKGFGM